MALVGPWKYRWAWGTAVPNSNQEPQKSKDHVILILVVLPSTESDLFQAVSFQKKQTLSILRGSAYNVSSPSNDFLRWAKSYTVGRKGEEN